MTAPKFTKPETYSERAERLASFFGARPGRALTVKAHTVRRHLRRTSWRAWTHVDHTREDAHLLDAALCLLLVLRCRAAPSRMADARLYDSLAEAVEELLESERAK